MASTFEALLLANMQFLLNPPIFYGTNTGGASTSIPSSSSGTAIQYDTNVCDTYSGHSTVTNNTRYVGQVPGYYVVSGTVLVDYATGSITGASTTYAYVFFNGVQVNGSKVGMLTPNTTGVGIGLSTSAIVFLNGTTDYVEIRVGQSASTVTLSTLSGVNASGFSVAWLHQ